MTASEIASSWPGFASMSSTSAGFKWFKANASRYGFYNLPSESWHWSTTGR